MIYYIMIYNAVLYPLTDYSMSCFDMQNFKDSDTNHKNSSCTTVKNSFFPISKMFLDILEHSVF